MLKLRDERKKNIAKYWKKKYKCDPEPTSVKTSKIVSINNDIRRRKNTVFRPLNIYVHAHLGTKNKPLPNTC